MKKTYLFPYRSKKVSGVLFWTTMLLLVVVFIKPDNLDSFGVNSKVFAIADSHFLEKPIYFGITTNNILDEILFVLLVVSGLVYAFSKEKVEDEMVSKIRLDSLVWATYFNYTLIILCYMFFYGFAFLNVMMIALFSHLLFFIIRFRWMMFKQNKLATDEE